MYGLVQSLLGHHLVVLRVMGEWWEMDLVGLDKMGCAEALAAQFEQLDLVEELSYISPEEAEAMQRLIQAEGRLPVGTFGRKYGTVRNMGPGLLEREEPWLAPANVAEALWYRGFIFRGFDEANEGLIEYYYVPEELAAKLGVLAVAESAETPYKPTPSDSTNSDNFLAPSPATPTLAPDHAIDDLTTILAIAQRNTLHKDNVTELAHYLWAPGRDQRSLLMTLALEMGLIKENEGIFRPTRNAITWLQQTRADQFRTLADAWRESSWNELRHVPTLSCEGSSWDNDPRLARPVLVDLLPQDQSWVDLKAVIGAIKLKNPDFQRPDGDYQTWYIRDLETQDYLSGFEHWAHVEGRVLAYLVEGPLHWLGLVNKSEGVCQWTERGLDWVLNRPKTTPPANEIPIIVQPDATLIVPRFASRYYRFQIARIAELDPVQPDRPYLYRITPHSLEKARQQGIKPQRVLSFLGEVTGGHALPASTRRAIQRWGENGTEGRIQSLIVLRVGDATVIKKLRQNPKTRDLLGESLGELAVVVRPDSWEKLQQITAQLGLLLDDSG